MYLYRAPLVVPVSQPPIENGAILVDKSGKIVAVDSYTALQGQGDLQDCDGSVLTPALINCHAHLELSHLAELTANKRWQGDITGWISKLLALRNSLPLEKALPAARQALLMLYNSGVAVTADIGNLVDSGEIGKGAPCRVDFYLEMLGLANVAAESGLHRLAECARGNRLCTGHAPYSTNKRLLVALKENARRTGALFPIHTAESLTELQFLDNGSGPLRSFIEEMGGWDDSFTAPGCGPVEYLDRIGVLDETTLCVHAVHVTDAELELIARYRAKVCLCPGSNRFLAVGVAPVEKMLAKGILPGLGTDSLASNPLLSIWQEMALLREDHPGLNPADVFRFATQGGAHSLRAAEYGSLAPGKSASILAVRAAGITAENAYEYLTSLGQGAEVMWVHGGTG